MQNNNNNNNNKSAIYNINQPFLQLSALASEKPVLVNL